MRASVCLLLALPLACGRHAPDTAPADAAAEAEAALAELRDAAAEDAAADAAVEDAGPAPAKLPGNSAGCSEDMLLVNGNYCPEVNQVCLEHHDEYNRDEARKADKRKGG